jgi:hypothetical protein
MAARLPAQKNVEQAGLKAQTGSAFTEEGIAKNTTFFWKREILN